MERDAEEKVIGYSAMLGSVSVITNVSDDNNEFYNDMTLDQKKERVGRSKGFLVHMRALDDWGSEDMTAIDAAISAANTFADS
tara:strand:+ start:1168 stop:1416 length:249 start_codon:yes stop_codon:yes gene_type:complete